MFWVTSRIIHFDRVASAWLISRFIDQDAEFRFIAPDTPFPPGATTFSLVGGDIGRHDEEGTTFTKLIKRYELKDPSLAELEKIVAAGVAYVMKGQMPGPDDRPAWIAVGLLAVAEGFLAMENSDADILRLSLPVWDAVYVEAGLRALRTAPPATPTSSEAHKATMFAMSLARHRQVPGRARNATMS
jgi:hypothetical protein